MVRIKWLVFSMVIMAHMNELTMAEEGLTDDEIATFNSRVTNTACGAKMDVTRDGDNIVIEKSGIPDHKFGCVNPNILAAQNDTIKLPAKPTIEDNPYCLPMGEIGLALNGVFLYNPLDGAMENAVEGDGAEIMDCCGGHANPLDLAYHYHQLPTTTNVNCDNPLFKTTDTLKLYGVAYDGFPIYGTTKSDHECISGLDKCSGTFTCPQSAGRYIYISVNDRFPYIIGCFKGKPILTNTVSCNYPENTVDPVCACDGCTSKILERSAITGSDKKKRSVIYRNESSTVGHNGKNKRETEDTCAPVDVCSGDGFTYSNDTCERSGGGGGGPPNGGSGGPPNDGGEGPPNGGGEGPPNGGGEGPPNGGGGGGGGSKMMVCNSNNLMNHVKANTFAVIFLLITTMIFFLFTL